jgi:hypothetical protein
MVDRDDADALAGRLLVAPRRELLDPGSALRRAIAGDAALEEAAALVVGAEQALADALLATPGPAPPLAVALRQWERRRWRRALVAVGWALGALLLAWAAVVLGLTLWAWAMLALET